MTKTPSEKQDIAALQKEYDDIRECEKSLGSYDEQRVNKSLERMRNIAWKIAYLKSSPERRAITDETPRELGIWP